MTARIVRTCIALACFAAQCSGADAWSPKAAAGYLDSRIAWWMAWPSAARDHDTFCVSCHTALPYAMARPALRAALAEQAPSPTEQKLVANVTKRVRIWTELEPFYADKKPGDPKTAESRGTESILNALVLAGYPDATLALDNMLAQQLKDGDSKGAWNWLQFHNSPWEGDSQYYGTTLAAIAVGSAPETYRSSPEVKNSIKLLAGYLAKNRSAQTLMDRVILLWASTKLPELLTPAERKQVIDEALSKQQPDGGFSLSGFVGTWKRRDNTPLETKSDGYATGVVTFVLQEAGVSRQKPQMQRGLAWLTSNQDATDGGWLAYSLNKQRDLTSDVGRFMSDAATAYAVLALEHAN